MSLITYNGILELIKDGVIENFDLDCLNGASLDVRLGNAIWTERAPNDRPQPSLLIVNLAAKETPNMNRVELGDSGYTLSPGQFILASTIEVFNLPRDVAAEFRLKSSSARAGLDQALAVWCDPGWHGSALTMELHNNLKYNWLTIKPGMRIGQMIFWRGEHVPHEASYAIKGQYNNDKSAQPSRGLR